MREIEQLFWIFFLNLQLRFWSAYAEDSCITIYVKRDCTYFVSAGTTYELACPVKYCANRPNVTWCKINGSNCLSLGDERKTLWTIKDNIPTFILRFDQVVVSDSGSYRCSVNLSTEIMESYSITLNVTEKIQTNSEYSLTTLADILDTSASRAPDNKVTAEKQWILYCLAPLGGLPLLIVCFYLLCCVRRHQGKQKKASDTVGREIDLVDVSQNFSRQIEVDTRQNFQTLSPETVIYDNDSQFRVQEEPGVYSNPCLEERNHGIVYASLNHSVIAVNPRQSTQEKETPTEYAAICVRS